MSLPQVKPESNLGSTLNKTITHVRENTIQGSADISVTKTASGMVLKVNPSIKEQALRDTIKFKGEWDINAQYDRDDVVYIEANKTYESSSVVYPVSPGWAICEVPVPDKRISDQLIALGAGSNPQYALFIRNPAINYFPHYPEPAATASYVNASGRYWKYISGALIAQYACEDGTESPVYVSMTVSGSTTIP